MHKRIWDPTSRLWRFLGDCVLQSRLPLTCRFAIASAYDLAKVEVLFSHQLKMGMVSATDLINELRSLKTSMYAVNGVSVPLRASSIYEWLLEMANSSDEELNIIRYV
jgi:hypothetical protein